MAMAVANYTISSTTSSAIINLQNRFKDTSSMTLVTETDSNPGDGKCETSAGTGTCTLRAAVAEVKCRRSGKLGMWFFRQVQSRLALHFPCLITSLFLVHVGTPVLLMGNAGNYPILQMSQTANLKVENLTLQNAGGTAISHNFMNNVGLVADGVRFENNKGAVSLGNDWLHGTIYQRYFLRVIRPRAWPRQLQSVGLQPRRLFQVAFLIPTLAVPCWSRPVQHQMSILPIPHFIKISDQEEAGRPFTWTVRGRH